MTHLKSFKLSLKKKFKKPITELVTVTERSTPLRDGVHVRQATVAITVTSIPRLQPARVAIMCL